jgi:hypothetical protein
MSGSEGELTLFGIRDPGLFFTGRGWWPRPGSAGAEAPALQPHKLLRAPSAEPPASLSEPRPLGQFVAASSASPAAGAAER